MAWSCVACETDNEVGADVCIVCGAKRSTSPTATSRPRLVEANPSTGHWHCPLCETENSTADADCVVCGATAEELRRIDEKRRAPTSTGRTTTTFSGISPDDFAVTSFERIGRLTDAAAETVKPWLSALEAADALTATKPTPADWARNQPSAVGCWSLLIAGIAVWYLLAAKKVSDDAQIACILAIAQFPVLLVIQRVRKTFRQQRSARKLREAEEHMAKCAPIESTVRDLRKLASAWRDVHKRCRNHPERARNMAANAAADIASAAVLRSLSTIPIESANIPIIPTSLLGVLRSRGILTAADIESHRITGIPGIGEKRRAALRAWRIRMEKRFTTDLRSPEATSAADAARAGVAAEARRDEAELERLTAAFRECGDPTALRNAITLWVEAKRRLLQAQADHGVPPVSPR